MIMKNLDTARDTGTNIDLQGLARKCNIQFFAYQEELPGQKKIEKEKRETRTAHFLHERTLDTGLKFYSKREMGEAVLAFSLYRLIDSAASLVSWGGGRGFRIVSTMSPERLQERDRAAAAAVGESA